VAGGAVIDEFTELKWVTIEPSDQGLSGLIGCSAGVGCAGAIYVALLGIS
jgi:hypothetical protein